MRLRHYPWSLRILSGRYRVLCTHLTGNETYDSLTAGRRPMSYMADLETTRFSDTFVFQHREEGV